MSGSRRLYLLTLGLFVLLAFTAAGCGGDDDSGGEAAAKSGTSTDRAFLEAMTPHHESAVAMTDVAADRAESPEIKEIASGIAEAQKPEIKQMQDIHQRLFGTPLVPNPGAHEKLGLTPEEAGAGHDDAALKLKDANPFDRAFVDEMVPHHQGAIRMAEVVVAKTADGEVRELAQGIIDTQKQEIEKMNAFRTREYGGPVPGSEDPAGGSMPEEDGGEHGGGHSG